MKRTNMKLILTIFMLVPLTVLQAGDVKLAAMFSDHMVLQCDRPVPFRWADSGEQVTVEFAGQTKSAKADADGKWTITLDSLPASAPPRELHVSLSAVASAEAERVTLHDVLIGEVWLCAGQSNMAMTVNGKTEWLRIGGIANAEEVVRDSANPLLRQFSVDWKTDTKPQQDCTGKWAVAGPIATANFSATGFFFARELQQRLKVPVGILSASLAARRWKAGRAARRWHANRTRSSSGR